MALQINPPTAAPHARVRLHWLAVAFFVLAPLSMLFGGLTVLGTAQHAFNLANTPTLVGTVMFLAGHETSASALSWALYLIARDRDVQDRMHAETDIAFGQEGDTGYIAVGQEIADLKAPATKIGDVDSFKRVVEGEAGSILFVNVNAALALPTVSSMLDGGAPDTRAWLEPVSSIGVVSTIKGDYAHAVMRVTFN